MSSNQSHSAIIFGSISIDRIENIHGSFNKVLGGSAAYALLANPKKTCELVGVVGNDFSDNHFKMLNDHSISTESLTQIKGNTFCWGGKYEDDFSRRKTLYVDPGVSDLYIPKLSDNSKNCSYILLGNTAPHLQMNLLNQMNSKPFVMLDTFQLYIDIANKELKDLIKLTDLLCINFNEAISLSELNSPTIDEMAKKILGLGPKNLIIKDGENGSSFFNAKEKFSIKAYPIKRVIDTTGAGDSYIGGVLLGMSRGMNIFESMKMGAVMASFCIEGIGTEGLANIDEEDIALRKEWMDKNHTS